MRYTFHDIFKKADSPYFVTILRDLITIIIILNNLMDCCVGKQTTKKEIKRRVVVPWQSANTNTESMSSESQTKKQTTQNDDALKEENSLMLQTIHSSIEREAKEGKKRRMLVIGASKGVGKAVAQHFAAESNWEVTFALGPK